MGLVVNVSQEGTKKAAGLPAKTFKTCRSSLRTGTTSDIFTSKSNADF